MKVIFTEDVPNVARSGDVKEVADGFGRNYLIPRKLAVMATKEELNKLEARRQSEARKESRFEQEAESVAKDINDTTVVLKAKAGEQDRIYGSVTSADIAGAIKDATGHAVDKRKIELDDPIRELGTRRIDIRLTRSVTATVNVVVEKE